MQIQVPEGVHEEWSPITPNINEPVTALIKEENSQDAGEVGIKELDLKEVK